MKLDTTVTAETINVYRQDQSKKQFYNKQSQESWKSAAQFDRT